MKFHSVTVRRYVREIAFPVCGLYRVPDFFGSVEIPDHTFEMGAMLNRFSTDIAKGVATVAGVKPPRTFVKMRFSTEPFFWFLIRKLGKN